MLKVYISENNFPNKKKPFVFRSQVMRKVTQEELIDEIATGSTVTRADAAAVFSMFEERFNEALMRGMSVELFMGTFFPSASGTAESMSETFRVRETRDPRSPKRDHKISLIFEPLKKYGKMLRQMQIERIGYKKLCHSRIDFIYNCMEGKNGFAPGDFIIIRGSFIKCEPSDESQGVFFKNRETGETTRAKIYTHTTRLKICAQIPSELKNADYDVFVKTEKGEQSSTANISITTL